jgi:hypothetical protein
MLSTPRPFTPSQLLRDLGIEGPEDIDVEAIAQYCGATIVYAPLKGCEARIIGYGDRAIITINSTSSFERKRFSAGHELGHWANDRGKALLTCTENQITSEWFADNPEKRANRFAAELLMPLQMFQSIAGNRPVTFSTVDVLAGVFRTSITATALRLVEHGPLPSMVICSDGKGRKWFSRSEILPKSLWPQELPGGLTGAFHLHKSGSPPQGPTVIRASEWIDHPTASRYVVTEDSRRITPDLVLTLLWWEDERQLLDLQEEEEQEDAESEKDPFD